MRPSALVLSLALASCSSLVEPALTPKVPTRDVAGFAVWQTRGVQVGSLAQRYCVDASERERAWMREAIVLNAYPAVVTIVCGALPSS